MGKYTTEHDRKEAEERIRDFDKLLEELPETEPRHKWIAMYREHTAKRLAKIERDLAKQKEQE